MAFNPQKNGQDIAISLTPSSAAEWEEYENLYSDLPTKPVFHRTAALIHRFCEYRDLLCPGQLRLMSYVMPVGAATLNPVGACSTIRAAWQFGKLR